MICIYYIVIKIKQSIVISKKDLGICLLDKILKFIDIRQLFNIS